MLRRIEADESAAALNSATAALAAQPIVPPVSESDADAGHLPQDHPQWVRDAVAISRAAREIVARLRPVFIAVMTMWDHRFRCIAIGGRRISVDVSGSYRMEI
jgi:hypothetical protein